MVANKERRIEDWALFFDPFFQASICRCILVVLWLPFGSLWLPLGSLWLPFGTLLAPFGSLLAPFGSLLVPCCSLSTFGSTLVPFFAPLASIFSFLFNFLIFQISSDLLSARFLPELRKIDWKRNGFSISHLSHTCFLLLRFFFTSNSKKTRT